MPGLTDFMCGVTRLNVALKLHRKEVQKDVLPAWIAKIAALDAEWKQQAKTAESRQRQKTKGIP
jgi:hypothetical protein